MLGTSHAGHTIKLQQPGLKYEPTYMDLPVVHGVLYAVVLFVRCELYGSLRDVFLKEIVHT